MRCSARLDLDDFFGSDQRRDELNGDLIRRRRTPPCAGASARRPLATSAAARPEVTSLWHVSTAERWRRTAAWLTLAMKDDLMDASVADMVVE